jgi:predicted transposase YdaD
VNTTKKIIAVFFYFIIWCCQYSGNIEEILEELKLAKEKLGKIEGQVVDNGEALQKMEEHVGNEDVENGKKENP